MKRRVLLAGLAALPAARAQAQQQAAEIRRIGVLSGFTKDVTDPWHAAFRESMRDLGWVEGRNLSIEARFADGDVSRLPALVNELLQLKVDVIVAESTAAAVAARQATQTVPIVVGSVGDPVATGLVANLARPGGNITGLSSNTVDLISKRLELLRLAVPELTDVAVLLAPNDTMSALAWREMQAPAQRLGLRLHSIEIAGPSELEAALKSELDPGVRALYVGTGSIFVTRHRPIAEFAIRQRLASIATVSEFARAGGLLGFGPDRLYTFRRVAAYVDKVLKGARPAELPIEQPIKYELVVNLTTARAIGITIPPLVLTQADEVIE